MLSVFSPRSTPTTWPMPKLSFTRATHDRIFWATTMASGTSSVSPRHRSQALQRLGLVGLAEVLDQGPVPADGPAAVAVHVVEVLAGRRPGTTRRPPASLADFSRIDFQRQEVAAGVEQHALGLQAVAAGPAGLLLVVLQRLGHGRVQHEADVGAVDAHAEGDRGHDHVALLARRTLPGPPGAASGVSRRGRAAALTPLLLQGRGQLVHVAAAQAVDDAGLAGVAVEHLAAPACIRSCRGSTR